MNGCQGELAIAKNETAENRAIEWSANDSPRHRGKLMRLDQVDTLRRRVSSATSRDRKSDLGQFMTAAPVARFMASLFPTQSHNRNARLLDAGAGVGSLASAFLDRYLAGDLEIDSVDVTAFEIDPPIAAHLDAVLASYAKRGSVSYGVEVGDFIEYGVNAAQFCTHSFTHAILNPPYKKIGTASKPRRLVDRLGVTTSNLYSAFLAVVIELLEQNGIVVAIIPRSFCNGPYFRSFREFLLSSARIEHIHLFDSRSRAFSDDDVLQENIIIRLRKGAAQGDVIVSTSCDDRFTDYSERVFRANEIVLPDDNERFIHVPAHIESSVEVSRAFTCRLSDLDISVSTGPVVDFRLKECLRHLPTENSVPLLYASHFNKSGGVVWPMAASKKPNAIVCTPESKKWLLPNGFYTVTRRFSSKEERRRVVAYTLDPNTFPSMTRLGLENHLNVYHRRKAGLPEALARGLTTYLNSSVVEESFRRFNGHTQVNATDLRQLKYPSEKALVELGEWATAQRGLSQSSIDEKVRDIA